MILRRMRLAGHVARMGRTRMHIGYCWEIQKERGHYEDQDVIGWIILRWIRWGGTQWTDLAQDRDQWGALNEHGNKSLGSIKYWEVFSVAAQLAASREGLSSMKIVSYPRI
jgi:hypothetical protein